MSQAQLNEKTYGQLLVRTLPRVIHNDRDLDHFMQELLRLDEIENPSPEEIQLADLLTALIEQYEVKHHPIGEPTPSETIRFLLEQRGLTAKDLWPVIGSKSHASEIINGKRGISKATAIKLGNFFHVKPDMFIEWKRESDHA